MKKNKRVHRAAAAALLLGGLAGCASVPAPRTWQGSDGAQAASQNAASACVAARQADADIGKAIGCAHSLAMAYDATALQLADQRQNYRHGEIALTVLSLGLAGFEAHVDTLKGAGLIAGATTSVKGSKQFAERIAAMDQGSERMLCVVEKARKAQAAGQRREAFVAQLNAFGPGGGASLVANDLGLSDTGSAQARLHAGVIDAIRRIESAALRRFRFSEEVQSPEQTISDAIEKAIALGKAEEAKQSGLAQAFDGRREKSDDDLAALRAASGAVEEDSAFEKALVELSACPAT